MEKFLQKYRFRAAEPYLVGDVLDFGGNEGELKQLVKGRYLAVNYDHSLMDGTRWNTIAILAVLEHMHTADAFVIFRKFKRILSGDGNIVLTTPSKIAKPVLEFMAMLGIVGRDSIKEHKHYWNKREIYVLAERTGFVVKKYKKIQLGFNQLVVFEHQ